MLLKYFLILNIFHISKFVNSEVYTALSELEDLYLTEKTLINYVERYVDFVQEKSSNLKNYINKFYDEHQKVGNNIQEYLSNPINAYMLVKRLTTDWLQLEKLITQNSEKDFIENITKIQETLKFPSEEDLNGAAVALTRLQDTYNLDTGSIASGQISGDGGTGPIENALMSASDCFELAKQAFYNNDYDHALSWFFEAYVRLHQQNDDQNLITKDEVLEYIAYSHYKKGNIILAYYYTKMLLNIDPDNKRAKENILYYLNHIKKNDALMFKGDRDFDTINDILENEAFSVLDKKKKSRSEINFYENLCRGEDQIPIDIQSKLKCRLLKTRSAITKLVPFKIEEMYLEPKILVFHDVMSDAEINVIKKLAQPRFRRATIQNHKTGELEVANYRISKSAWLREEEHPYIKAISRRIEAMTDLTVKTAEELQVVNYGIGGHYEPHFDYARKSEKNAFKSLGTGNRIATVLFYMSDVEKGGATVFPMINVTLWPKKGTAAFWFNLHSSGEGNILTRHAACPVLVGSKFVSNKWLHERGQEFLRPCDLERGPIEIDYYPF